LDDIESTKINNIKNQPVKNQAPVMEMNNLNNNNNNNNNMNMHMNQLPFNQGANIMNQLPMMGFNNNMFDQFSKEEILQQQLMQQRPPLSMVPPGHNFMDNSPQPNPNMFLQFNQNLPPQLQFPPQFQNELHQGIYPGMMSNMQPPQQQQMHMENLMTRRSIPISMMLSGKI